MISLRADRCVRSRRAAFITVGVALKSDEPAARSFYTILLLPRACIDLNQRFPFLGSDPRQNTVKECERGGSALSTGAKQESRQEDEADAKLRDEEEKDEKQVDG